MRIPANDVRLMIKMHEKGKHGFDDGLGLTVDDEDERRQVSRR